MRRGRKRDATRRFRESLPALLAGASLGALVTWLLKRPDPADSAREHGPAREGSDEPRARLGEALGGALGARPARERRGREGALDLERLRADVLLIPGCDEVHLRELGDGIVEALGAAPDPGTVQQVLSWLRSVPGVTVVVNRIWTPASAHAKKPDLSHIPRVRRDSSVN